MVFALLAAKRNNSLKLSHKTELLHLLTNFILSKLKKTVPVCIWEGNGHRMFLLPYHHSVVAKVMPKHLSLKFKEFCSHLFLSAISKIQYENMISR